MGIHVNVFVFQEFAPFFMTVYVANLVSTTFIRKNLTMDEIHDIHGLRLVVENEEDCYKALDIVHGLWTKVVGRFKDYIDHPKSNGYTLKSN